MRPRTLIILITLAGSKWSDVAEEMGLRVGREAFADRGVNADGTLVPRRMPGSAIEDGEYFDLDEVWYHSRSASAIKLHGFGHTGEGDAWVVESFDSPVNWLLLAANWMKASIPWSAPCVWKIP